MQREYGLSRRFLKENAPDFPLKEIEERQHESRLHLVCICLPTVAPLKCEPGLRWLSTDSIQINPVRIFFFLLPVCETKSRALLHVCFSPRVETIAMAALSRRYMQSAGQLCLVIGSWTNHKSQAVFFSLRPHNGRQRTDSLILYDGHLES